MNRFVDFMQWLMAWIAFYWSFEEVEFEKFEVDQRPDFYLIVVTLRPKKKGALK